MIGRRVEGRGTTWVGGGSEVRGWLRKERESGEGGLEDAK